MSNTDSAEKVQTARVPLIGDDNGDPIVNEVFHRFKMENRKPISLYRALANCPQLLKDYSALAICLRYEATTGRDLRELVILRIAQMNGSEYEWSHHRPMAADAGISEVQILNLGSWETSELFNERQRVALQVAEGVHGAKLGSATFDEARALLGEAETIEIVVVAAFYEAVGRIIQGLGIQIEPEYSGFLDSGHVEMGTADEDHSK